MSVREDKYNVVTEGINDTVEYRIENNSYMNDILAKRIYSRHIEAVIRELSTNAWDAHITANKQNKPFKVHLPTVADPTFIIRDYGDGLSKESLKTMYSVFGRSGSRESEKASELTGMMGLGSKSPFAYADSFITTSVCNGLKVICTNYKDERGNFRMSFTDEVPTDEESGLEIKVPVKKCDIRDFSDTAKQVYKWFPIWPEIDIDPEQLEPDYSRENWELYGESRSYYYSYNNDKNRYPVAVMGNVGYRIDATQITKDRKFRTLLESYKTVMRFDIDDLDINAGREDLQYTKHTIKNVLRVCEDIIKELTGEVQQSLDQCSTRWEALCNLNSNASIYSRLIDTGKLTFQGKSLPSGRMTLIPDGSSVGSQITVEAVSLTYSGKTASHYPTNNIKPSKDVGFLYKDITSGQYKGCKHFLDTTEFSQACLCTFSTQEAKRVFFEWFGLDETNFEKVSEYYVRPERQKGGKKKSQLSEGYKYSWDGRANNPSSLYAGRYWEPTKIDMSTGGIYVPIAYFLPVSGTYPALDRIRQILKEVGIIDQDTVIYGIRKAYVAKFAASPDWQNLYDYCRIKLEEYNRKDLQALKDHSDVQAVFSEIDDVVAKRNSINANSELRKLIEEGLYCWENSHKNQQLRSLYSSFKLKNPITSTSYDFVGEWKMILSRFPCLELASDVKYDKTGTKNLIDTHNKLDDLYNEVNRLKALTCK